jgi:MFS family permease
MQRVSDGATVTPQREFATVLVLALGFGLVGIDRFLITTLFPVISKALSLDYSDIGVISGALSIAWGLAALFAGNLSDRIGRRPVLVGAMLLFSTLIGASGFAIGLLSLVAVRIVMGVADGAFTPASIAATLHVSPYHRRGRNLGLQQMTSTLFGLGFAPLLVTALLHVIAWRWIFALFVIPGFALAYLVWILIPPRDAAPKTTDAAAARRTLRGDFSAAIGYRNIRLLMGLMLVWLTCLISISAFLPSYLLDHLHLGFDQMGMVMSAIGFGSAAGTILLPWLSDRIGRRPVAMIAVAGALGSIFLLSRCGPQVAPLFACTFVAMGCVMAGITLTVGPICDESVPFGLGTTASGMVIAVGELFGGGIAPILVGRIAQRFGIEHMLWLPMAALVVGLLIAFAVQETRGPNYAKPKSVCWPSRHIAAKSDAKEVF